MSNYKVYFNSRDKNFSVLADGKVRFRTNSVMLRNVEFKVSHKGWLRANKTGVKNVHAFVCGELHFWPPKKEKLINVSYNFRNPAPFFCDPDGNPVFYSPYVEMNISNGKPIVRAKV